MCPCPPMTRAANIRALCDRPPGMRTIHGPFPWPGTGAFPTAITPGAGRAFGVRTDASRSYQAMGHRPRTVGILRLRPRPVRRPVPVAAEHGAWRHPDLAERLRGAHVRAVGVR